MFHDEYTQVIRAMFALKKCTDIRFAQMNAHTMNLSNLLKKRIPTILGLLFLGSGLAVGVLIIGNSTGGFFPKASPETTPKKIKVTNVTDSSFTISFITDTAVPGYVKYGVSASKLDQRASDDRDRITGSVGSYVTHHISVPNLSPSTTYYFEIGTASRLMYSNGGTPYTTKTGAKLSTTPEALTIYGNVITSASTPAKDSIVYAVIEGGAPISTLVKSSGSWAIPISSARTADTSSYLSVNNSTSIEIFVQGKDEQNTSSIETVVGEAQPVPTLTLGKDAVPTTATLSEELGTPKEETNSSSNVVNDSSSDLESNMESSADTTTSSESEDVQFLNPSRDGEVINTTQPELRGTAPADREVSIMVESDPVYTETLVTDENGDWSYTPPADLAPGEHTLTLSYVDDNGVTQTAKRTFLVAATGTSKLPAIVSTPSATPKTLATPSTTPSATPKATASARPSVRTANPSTIAGVPKSGSVGYTYGMLIAGFLCIAGGFVLLRNTVQLRENHE